MTIDRARNSFDPTRDWRAVLAQQGRVTLEADVNEQAMLAGEARRLEAIDVIGPVGTPDGGYEISTAPGGTDVQVSAGTLYVAGERLTLANAITTAAQPAWLDMPAWPTPAGNQIVTLLVTEQTVVAVEDTALQEVALGGPDSAGRLRLLQHVLRLPSTAASCADAATALGTIASAAGQTYDPADCALTSNATLLVTPVAASTTGGPCDPPAQGGYLGADNQMIRVAVIDYDPVKGAGTLVWGWNNASFLHRATVAQANVLQLLADPLDPDHQPQTGQAVEILRCTVDLGDGDRSYSGGGNFIAAASGLVMTLSAGQGYDSGTRRLTLPNNLPPTYQGDAPRPLFVRLWDATLPFTANAAVTLGDTGLSVTIANPPRNDAIGGRPYWQFAVRPSTPQQVYPQRYLTTPQPPDGPRQFLASLGVVGWDAKAGFTLIEDCSVPFLPLTKLHDCNCCSMVLDPEKDWLTQLQQAIADAKVQALSVCFQPGTFTVAATIRCANKSVRMTGAGAATRIVGAGLEVVLEFDNCPDLGLADLSVQAGTTGYSNNAATAGLQGAVTARNCGTVEIERVTMSCADGDLRAASCLAIYNSVPAAGAAPQQYNARVLNSRFNVGHFQVGVLLVNADRAQIEGNVIVTPPQVRFTTLEQLSANKATALRLRRQLLNGMLLTDIAPPVTKKARARLRKRQAALARPAAATNSTGAELKAATIPVEVAPQPASLGTLGRAHVRASFGNFRLQFVSSDKLGNAWTDALRTSSLSETSTMGTIHRAVLKIANAVVLTPNAVAPAFRNWLATTLPQLYSTSGQGIVIGGNLANDVRILNNTIDGTVQGIHVGLSDLKIVPHAAHLIATRVQIRGNTINIRVTPETTGDRHGIFLGCVASGIVAENHLQLSRSSQAGQNIDAIKVAGFFGPLLLVERNSMQGFSNGIYTAQDATSVPAGVLWKIAENVSSAPHQISAGLFRTADNVP